MIAKYFDLKNKRVFITGGGSGIGASIVEHFCEQDSEVYFVDINVKESNKFISDIKNKKVFLSPHASTFTEECAERTGIETIQNIIDFFDGKLDESMIIKL